MKVCYYDMLISMGTHHPFSVVVKDIRVQCQSDLHAML